MAIIERSDAQSLMPEDVSREIIQNITTESIVLSMFRRLPNMIRKQHRMPVLENLPVAGFVDGDYGLKSVSTAKWGDKFISAEEIAVIVPIPEAVLADSAYDIWAQIKPLIVAEFGRVVDAAALFGTGRTPSVIANWPSPIIPEAIARGKAVALGTESDIALDISEGMATVEDSGYDVTGFAAAMRIKSKLRGLRDNSDALLFQPSLTAGTPGTLYGQPIRYPQNGVWDDKTALLLGGDFSQAVYSIRQDVTYKVLDQGVLTDSDGKVLLNFGQQDSVGLRCVMRLGWQIPNPINLMDTNPATRYPFFVLQPASTTPPVDPPDPPDPPGQT